MSRPEQHPSGENREDNTQQEGKRPFVPEAPMVHADPEQQATYNRFDEAANRLKKAIADLLKQHPSE